MRISTSVSAGKHCIRNIKASSSVAAAGHRAASETEMAQYKALTVQATAAVKLVAFWRQNTEQFPILSMTAHKIFCIFASSAQSERDFSPVSHNVTEMRSRLSSKKIETIVLMLSGLRLNVLIWGLFAKRHRNNTM